MKIDWIDYPLTAFSSAVASTVGGLAVLVAALSLGTWAGLYALSGEIFWPSDAGEWIVIVFAFAGPIALSCLQLWGFLYVGIIASFAYVLVFQDASRLRIASLILFPQFLCTVIATSVMNGRGRFDSEMLFRSLLVGGFLLVCALPSIIIWMRTWTQSSMLRSID